MIFSSDALPHQSPLLQMRDIHKRFGGTVALDGVGLEVSQGEVLALVGENGAGKSTLMKVLSGAIKADSGEMTLGNKAFMPRYPLDAKRCGVAMIYQELSLALHLTVEENITLGLEPGRFGLVDRKEVRRRALQSLQHFNHPEITPQSRTGDLSVATQQLVEIARALAMGCRVLILDEPTSSLSREDVRELFELVRQLKNQGHAIIYISHFIEEVQKVADRVTVLRDGRSVGTHEVAGITVDKIVALMVGRNVKQL